jgi:threonylcarbamoyladenosine tRNA methylthiotransferase MtaB
MPTFTSIYFGCRANQADSAALERDLARRGFEPAAQPSAADVVVLNSCTVTAAADAELRQTVRRLRRDNPAARILVTGCYAQRRPDELAALPGIEWVVGNSHKAEIPPLLAESLSPSRGGFVPLDSLLSPTNPSIDSDLRLLGSIAPGKDSGKLAGEPSVLVGDISRQRQVVSAPHFCGAVEDRARPNLKIQDGCNNRCSFCVIPAVRGFSRSLPVSDVLSQVRSLAAAGYREVVLSGVNLGQYGRDLLPSGARPLPLVQLLRTILDETPVERLRLSSVEPMDFTDRLLDLMASTPRIARHVHAPLQSGSDRILRRMHRKYRAAQYRERILAAQERMPEAAFGADVIVGFPGETDEDFEATRRLIEELPFTYLHVFPFSRRPDTPADRMKNQVHGAVVRERGRFLRELAAEKNRRFRERHLGRTLRVLTLGANAVGEVMALSENYIRVALAETAPAANQWIEARIYSVTESGLAANRLSGGEHPLAEAAPGQRVERR